MKDVILLSRLSLLSSALADLGRETSLDGRDGTSGTARVAGDEVETVLTLVELCIRRAAGLASNVLDCWLLLAFAYRFCGR
jgi:hypothetical protein